MQGRPFFVTREGSDSCVLVLLGYASVFVLHSKLGNQHLTLRSERGKIISNSLKNFFLTPEIQLPDRAAVSSIRIFNLRKQDIPVNLSFPTP